MAATIVFIRPISTTESKR